MIISTLQNILGDYDWQFKTKLHSMAILCLIHSLQNATFERLEIMIAHCSTSIDFTQFLISSFNKCIYGSAYFRSELDHKE